MEEERWCLHAYRTSEFTLYFVLVRSCTQGSRDSCHGRPRDSPSSTCFVLKDKETLLSTV